LRHRQGCRVRLLQLSVSTVPAWAMADSARTTSPGLRVPATVSQVRRRARGPVGRVLCTRVTAGRRPSIWDCHCWQPPAVNQRARAGRPQALAREAGASQSRPSSRWGLPSHLGHPRRWWSLTPPFHPYRRTDPAAVYFLWHFPAGCPGSVLPTTLPCGARTFLSGTRSPRTPPRPPGHLARRCP